MFGLERRCQCSLILCPEELRTNFEPTANTHFQQTLSDATPQLRGANGWTAGNIEKPPTGRRQTEANWKQDEERDRERANCRREWASPLLHSLKCLTLETGRSSFVKLSVRSRFRAIVNSISYQLWAVEVVEVGEVEQEQRKTRI